MRGCAGCKRWVETGGDRVEAGGRLAGMPELVVNLDELNLRELFDICHQGTSDIIKRAVRLTIPGQIHMNSSIGKDEPVIPGKAIQDRGKSLVTLHITGTFEEFVQHSRYAIF